MQRFSTDERLINLRPLFGAPSADHDHLLADCRLEDQIGKYHDPIIVGRWGTGKTAILISRARHIEEVLGAADPLKKRDWYIREQDLQPDSIFSLQKKFSESPEYLNACLQKIWRSEIYRRVILVLAALADVYKDEAFTKFNHWKFVSAISLREHASESFWSCIGSIIDVIFSEREVREATRAFAEYFDQISSARANECVQRCILDLEGYKLVTPVIGIEPLETPASNLDQKVGLAESVIAALLNCYRNDFIFSDSQRIKVNISIPWNRINNKMINLPQHISPYQGEVSWNKDNLRRFINRRIGQESRDSGAQKIQARPNFDEWDSAFTKTIMNKAYTDHFMRNESSFDYVCRHTLWRARDLQTIARDSVMHYCSRLGITTQEFFRKGHKVDEDSLRIAVAKNSRVNADLRIEEARRRFNFNFDVSSSLYGMRVPFEEDDLRSRIVDDDSYKTWTARVDALWESGIIGICVQLADASSLRAFENRFGTQSFRRVSYKPYMAIGFVFQYNSGFAGSPLSIKETLQRDGDGNQVKFLIHPTFNEALDLHLVGEYPLGC